MDLPLRSGKATRPKPPPKKKAKKKKEATAAFPYLAIAKAVCAMSDQVLGQVTQADPSLLAPDQQWRYRCAVAEQNRRRRGCKGCGKPVDKGYWCCDSCFYAEDGWLGTPEQEEELDGEVPSPASQDE